MIHFTKEGTKIKLGLNIQRPSKYTLWSFTIVLPIWISFNNFYQDFQTGDLILGHQLYSLNWRLRKRRKRRFPKKVRTYLTGLKIGWERFGKIRLLLTEELLEDWKLSPSVICRINGRHIYDISI